MSNTYPFKDFLNRFGVRLLMLMPLISLTNVWKIATFSGLSIRVIDLLFLLTLFICAQYIFLHKKIRRGVLLYLGLILTLHLVSLFGLIILPDYQVNWPALLRFTQTMLWGGLALVFVRNKKDLKIIARNVIIAGTVLASFSIYLRLTKEGLHRIAGFFSAAGGAGLDRQAGFNEIGALYALASLLSLYYMYWDGKTLWQWKTITFGFCLFLNLIGLILVQSRSAFLAFTIGCFAFIFPQIKKLLVQGKVSSWTITYTITILIVSILIAAGSVYFAGVNRLMRTFMPESNEYTSAITRFALWNKAIQIWLDRVPYFLLGYGFRTAGRFLGTESAHNLFLNIGLWLGLVGFFSMTLILMWPTIKTIKSNNPATAAMTVTTFSVALVVSIFGNVLADPFYGGCTFLLLYAAMAVSYTQKAGRR